MEEERIMREINGKELSVNDLVIPLSFGVRVTDKNNLLALVISRDKVWCYYNGEYRLKTCDSCLKVEIGELGEYAKEQYKLLSSTYMEKMNKKLSFLKFKSSDLKPGQVFKVSSPSKHGAFYAYIYIGNYDLSMSGNADVEGYLYSARNKILPYNRSVSRKYLFLRYIFYSLKDLNNFLDKLAIYCSSIIDMNTLMSLDAVYSREFYAGLEPVYKLPPYLEHLFDIEINELLNTPSCFTVSFSFANRGPYVYVPNYGRGFLKDVDIIFKNR